MQANTFKEGDRVQLIPFKHKGKVATVRYFGQIGRKFGTWVGLELEDPSGDNNGEVNGEQLFECEENYGLILRNTQVRLLTDGGELPASLKGSLLEESKTEKRSSTMIVPSLKEGLAQMLEQKVFGDDDGDSPLVTPNKGFEEMLQDPLNSAQNRQQAQDLMSRMTQVIAEAPKPQDAGESDAKKKGWQERLEKLRVKKQEEKKAEAVRRESKIVDIEKVREEFGLSTGMKMSEASDGSKVLKVNQEEVDKPLDGQEILQEAQEKEARSPRIQTKPSGLRPPSPRSRLPGGTSQSVITPATLQKPVAVPKIGAGSSAIGGGIRKTNVSKREELKAKQEELEKQRNLRKTGATPRTAVTKKAPDGKSPLSTTQSGRTSIRGGTAATSAATTSIRGGAAATAPQVRMTLAERTAKAALEAQEKAAANRALKDEEKETKQKLMTRKPAMTASITAPGMRRQASRSRSNTRNTLSTPSVVAQQPGSPRAVNERPSFTGGIRPPAMGVGSKPTVKTGPAPPNRTFSSGLSVKTPTTPGTGAGATPAEIKKWEQQIKEKTDQVDKLAIEIKKLKEEKEAITKEKEEHQTSALKAKKEVDMVKNQLELKISTLQSQIASSETGDDQVQANMQAQNDQILQDKQKFEEETVAKIADFEVQVESLKNTLAEKEKELAEIQEKIETYETALKDQELRLTEQEIKMTEQEILLKEQQDKHNEEIAKLVQEAEQITADAEARVNSAAGDSQAREDLEHQMTAKFEETQKSFEERIAAKDAELKKLSEQSEQDKKDAETKLKEEGERREQEIEIFELELQQVKDDKQDLLDKIMEQSKVDEEDPLKDLGIEEIKLQNQKLRQALTSLKLGFEEEQRKMQEQMEKETGKDQIIKDQEDSLKNMNFLLDEVQRKEKEVNDMQEKLDEIVEYENMVEEMVEEIATKEEENEGLVERITELEEEMVLIEEINEALESDNKDLNEELAQKDKELVDSKNEQRQLEEIVIDQDGLGQKYQTKQQELLKQITVLSDQLAETANDGNKDQVSILIEKQQHLIARLREADKKSLHITKNQIMMQQEKMGVEIVQNMLPESLMNEAMLPQLKKIQNLNFVRHKSLMLLREICESQVESAQGVYDDKDQLMQYYHTLLNISLLTNRVIKSSGRVSFFVANMTPGQYAEITKLLSWEKLESVTSQIDSILVMLKEENLAYNFDTKEYAGVTEEVEQLMSITEKQFVAVSPEDVKQKEIIESDGASHADFITQQHRQNLANKCAKLDIREQAIQMAIGVTFVPRIQTVYENELEKRQVIQKVGLIYWRLLDIVLKIDFIENTKNGEEYIDQDNLRTDDHLQEKWASICLLWEGTAEEKKSAQEKSWMSIIEAVERDITQLNNDFKFRKLAEKVEQRYGTGKVDFSDLYTLDYQCQGPWRVVSEQVKTELQDMGALKQKNTQLLEKQKGTAQQIAILKKEKDEHSFIYQTMQGKLSQAQLKAEQVPALEIEKKDLKDKIDQLAKELVSSTEQNNVNRTSIDDFKKKLEDAKKLQRAGPAYGDDYAQGRPSIKARPSASKGQSRQSRTSNFFQNLQMSGFKKQDEEQAAHARKPSAYNNQQMLQQLQLSEDVFINTINELQADRMRLKGKDMLARLSKLQREEGAFNMLVHQLRESQKADQGEVSVKLNRVEQSKVEEALESVESLKSKVKRQMATRRIVDLSKPLEDQTTFQSKNDALDAVRSELKVNTESQNYLLVEAREKINDAMEVLFTKDSRLRKLQIPSRVPTQTEDATQEIAKENNISEVKVGQFKLRGKIRVPNRRVVLNESALAELKRNVMLFSN